MATEIVTTGYRALAPWDTRTFSAGHEGAHLDQRLWEELHKRYEEFEPHRAILCELARRINALRTWGAEWEDYDAAPPTPRTVDRAHEWISQLYLDAYLIGRPWVDPLITASEEGEAMFEWQLQGRRLTIRVTEAGATYSKLWGTRPNFHFEDGVAETRQRTQSLWAWLVG
jgi:hypothetical protein